MTMDDRGKLNHQMLMDSITHKEYSGGIRNNLVGKRGILRQACMGIRPLMMIRGRHDNSIQKDYQQASIAVLGPQRYKPSVGVHRAIYQHLNLDFDDEIHTAVVSSVAVIEEIQSLIQKDPLFNKFLVEAVLDITSEMTANLGGIAKLEGYSTRYE
ncbi:hypothetical protein CU097_005039 [Rhizopus azygosporus]|uniref:Uncharacterized protein n=1 Tax=Rhizopus azygosporus TaxID=86630 RepID=A0A367J403_RHIAZ|nr:hypothetical protein CU097_005039 [Rhizopus azygosporus]